MHQTIEQNVTRPRRRMLAGFGVLVLFSVGFALPLYAALTLCTMPCCHRTGGAHAPVIATDMPACGTRCSLRSDEATRTDLQTVAPASGTVSSIAPASMATVFAGAPMRTSLERDDGLAHATGAPLHVLNSVFRI